jgi:putative salt-induced outer membrane protein YdiY
MTLLLNSRARLATLTAAAFGAMLLATSAAQAFTFENPGAPAGNPSALRFGTGDTRFSTSTGNGATSSPPGRSGLSSGNSSLQFGGQSSFNQRYNADRMFDSNNILGKDR